MTNAANKSSWLGRWLLAWTASSFLAGCASLDQDDAGQTSNGDRPTAKPATAQHLQTRAGDSNTVGPPPWLREISAPAPEPVPPRQALSPPPTLAKNHLEALAAIGSQQDDDASSLESKPPHSLWTRIRAGFDLPEEAHDRVAAEVRWFANHPGYLRRVAQRAEPYLYHIVEQVAARDMPMEIALLPVVESAFQPFAYSPGRASGLWQFVPGTAQRFDLDINWWYDGRRDVLTSTEAALDYLQLLRDHFDGDWLLALAAYNAGEGRVLQAIRRNQRQNQATDFWSLPLPQETQGYVPRLLAVAQVVSNPQTHGLTLRPIPNRPYLASVELEAQMDLALAADLAGMSVDALYELNPALNRWATPPGGPHHLLLPRQNVETFREQLASLSTERMMRWQRHRIRKGETLSHLAVRYHTTVDALRQANDLGGSTIRAGDHLLVPVATQSYAKYTKTASQRQQATQNAARAGRKFTYEVSAGDTLWDLAQNYGVTVDQLARWNAMAPGDWLRPGQELVIWADGRNVTASAQSTDSRDMTRRITYTVRPGDSLSRISQRFNVTVNELAEWNALDPSNYLQPGQVLTVYVDITQLAETG